MAEPAMEPEPGMEPEPEAEPEPEPVSAEAVLRELELFELRCEGEDGPGRLLELCVTHALDPVTLANELLAFVTTKELGTRLGAHTLDAFEHEVLSRRRSRSPRRGDRHQRGLHDVHSLQDLLEEEEEDELLDAYATPCKGAQKRGSSSPERPRRKRLQRHSPLGHLSPGSFSPSATPSRHYASRGGRGDVVAALGDAPGTSWSSLGTPSCAPQLFGAPERHLSKPYKLMFQKPLDVREALLWRMEELGDALKRHHQLEDFASVTLPAQEPVTVLGQITCDGAGRLNAHSVLLVGDAAHAGGAQLPLDLSELAEFSLFPGQIVALEGTNSTGRRMRVTRIYEGVPLPFHAPTEPLPDHVSVLVACGPFTPSDGVAFEPLRDLLDVIERDRPDLCLLLGPFLDDRHEQVQRCELPGSFGDVFRLCLRSLLDGTRSWRPPLVLVPSPRDVALPPVFPQPPLPWPDLPRADRSRVLLVPNPCTLDLGGTILGVTSTDLLLHLGAEETNRSAGGSDRFTRILKHILTQRSYYPLYPPSEELNVDYEGLYSYGSLPVTPHVLVTPSDLRYFVKDVLGCVCLNPGRLAKGRAGGTFGRLSLRRGADGTPRVAAQVVRI